MIVDEDEFSERNLDKAGYGSNPLEDGSLEGYMLHRVPMTSLAVTEPGVMRAALCYVLKAPPHAYWRIDARPLAVVTLSGRAGDWNLNLEK